MRNAKTALSNASLASIIAQFPQFGNARSSALGSVRIGISAHAHNAEVDAGPLGGVDTAAIAVRPDRL